jgi:hypothetical protein
MQVLPHQAGKVTSVLRRQVDDTTHVDDVGWQTLVLDITLSTGHTLAQELAKEVSYARIVEALDSLLDAFGTVGEHAGGKRLRSRDALEL